MSPLDIIDIIQNPNLVEGPFEDWSDVRSPGRAARRRKMGHPQRIRIYYTPSRKIVVLGNKIICHPVMYHLITKEVMRRRSSM